MTLGLIGLKFQYNHVHKTAVSLKFNLPPEFLSSSRQTLEHEITFQPDNVDQFDNETFKINYHVTEISKIVLLCSGKEIHNVLCHR